MIVSKTRMNKLPSSCSKCPYYFVERGFGRPDARLCYGYGKAFELEKNVKLTIECSKKCPLMEIG